MFLLGSIIITDIFRARRLHSKLVVVVNGVYCLYELGFQEITLFNLFDISMPNFIVLNSFITA